ncbi:DJ-1/PfpI family protein [Ekhidna sp.]|uniref:DJ-1/PfpI family protein n=1 Tax=Ekhidna sp. TaxID=2608089 RepID=UPI0032ECCAD8
MKTIIQMVLLTGIAFACSNQKPDLEPQPQHKMQKEINPDIPTIGILIFEGFLTNEIAAPLDVFTKSDANGNVLFNVITIAKETKTYVSEEGLGIVPDMLIEEAPELKVLIVPSSFRPDLQVADSAMIQFIRKQNQSADYIASHCAGALMLGQSGIANNKKIVTYVGGAERLQENYPALLVQNDEEVDYILDGNIMSSNGSLVSYPASLALLEKLTSAEHRKYVENELLYHKLK